MAPDHTEHPRARALRVTYVGTSLFFVIASVGLALATRDVAAGATGLALFSIATATTIAIAGTPDLLPRGAPLTDGEKRLLGNGVIVTVAIALLLLVLVAASAVPPTLLFVPALMSVLLGTAAIVIALR